MIYQESSYIMDELRAKGVTAQCAVRGHPPNDLSDLRYKPGIRPSPLGVGGHIGESELPWESALLRWREARRRKILRELKREGEDA